MCNMDCFNCVKKDCTNNALSDTERKAQDAYDRECIKEHIPEERSGLRKGNKKQYDYFHTEKGKAALRRYNQSEKGKAAQKRYADKKVASGKNAEYCRRYRERKKAEREG